MKAKNTGFTLIELLVAMTIFAMLAVAGWQVMDSITKSRDRGNAQLTKLSQLQYAYLQLSQDFAQTTNYVSIPAGISATQQGKVAAVQPRPTFNLSAEKVDFVRLADPDPRFNPPPTLAHIIYVIDNGKLVKQRFYQLNNPNESPSSSVILNDIKDAKWTALTPKTVDVFPDSTTLQQAKSSNTLPLQQNQNTPNNASNASNQNPSENLLDLTAFQQLPKGVQLNFTYNEQPMVWRFALPSQMPSVVQPMTLNSAPQTASQINPAGATGLTNNANNAASNNTALNNINNNYSTNIDNSTNSNVSDTVNGRPEGDN